MTDITQRLTGAEAWADKVFEASAADLRATIDGVTFQLITEVTDLDKIGPEWDDLFASAGTAAQVFQTFAWNRLWCRHYLDAHNTQSATWTRLAIVTGRRAGRLVLLWPLVLERVAGLRQLAWMGHPVSQYGDVLAAPEVGGEAILRAAWRFAVALTRADVAHLRKVRVSSIAAKALADLGASVVGTEHAPHVALAGAHSFAACEARFTPKGRKNRSRHMRRLRDAGAVAFASYSNGEDAALLAERAVAMKRESLARKAQISRALADDRFQQFFSDAALGHQRGIDCEISSITCDGEIAAIQIVLECLRHRFLHVAVYGARFEKYGVGGLLLEHTLRNSFDGGIERFDLLAPRHAYKMEFARDVEAVHDYALGITLRGRLYARLGLGLRQTLKQGVERLPAPVRSFIVARLARAQ